MNEMKLKFAIEEYLTKRSSNGDYYNENWTDRVTRKEYYSSFTKDKLLKMTADDMLEYIGKLWSMIIWGNKKYVVDKLISDNGLENLKAKLAELLYGKDPIEERWDDFLKNVKGIGPSTISELLTYIDPERCMIFNKTTVLCYTYLKIPDMPKYNYQYTGKKYVEICNIAKEIASIMKASGLKETDMLAVDYFLWDEVLPLAEERELPESPISDTLDDIKPMNAKETKSLHDEIKEKLVDIGRMLGFESRSEVHISSGAVVDAV